MPPRVWVFRVKDILEAIRRIEDYTEGMTFETFRDDAKTQDAVLRNIAVIGEAARHIPEELVKRNPTIPWPDMRDIVIHEYFGVSLKIVWETIQNDIPPLVGPLEELIKEEA